MTTAIETATFGGGCFWCLEAIFSRLAAVRSAESGYAGGHLVDPTYKQVCSGDTGHAEVVQICFDASQLSYETLLDIFFTIHDPTTLNRQGEDVGSQYRSVIYYHNEQQRLAAQAAIIRHQPEWPDAIVTQLAPLDTFYPAEDYHRQYFELHGHEPYCALTVAPKVAKFEQRYAALLKP